MAGKQVPLRRVKLGVKPGRDGTDAVWNNKVIVVEGRGSVLEVPIAHNELLGIWKFRVTDWFRGSLVDVACEVR